MRFLHGSFFTLIYIYIYRQWVPLVSAIPLTILYRSYRQWVPCKHNSSYNFIPIFCFLHSLNCCHFFSTFWTLSFSDLRCIDSGTLYTILNWSFWNFAHVFSQVCRNASGLDMIFKFIFVTFSTLTLSFSYLRFYESVQTVGTFRAQLLMHHMRKCICFWWNSYINFFYLK